MLENLRQDFNSSELLQEPEPEPPKKWEPPKVPTVPDRVLGMTAPQRFIISLLMFVMTFLVGALCLMLTGRILPPF